MKKNSNETKVKKTVSFTENKNFEPEVEVREAKEVLSKNGSYTLDLSEEAKERFSTESNAQIAKIIGQILPLKLNYPQKEVADTMIELCGTIQNSENYEIKENLVQFWRMVPKDSNLFRKKCWQKVNNSLGATKLTAKDYFAELAERINQDGDDVLKEVLGRYESVLESYESNSLAIHEKKEKALEEDIQKLTQDLKETDSQEDVDDESLRDEYKNNLKLNLREQQQNLKKAAIEKYIFTQAPQEDELSLNLSLIKDDYRTRRVPIADKIIKEQQSNPENVKRLSWEWRIINAEEDIDLINCISWNMPCNDYIVGLIQSDSKLKSQYQNQLQKELGRENLTQQLPGLESNLNHLRFIEDNYSNLVELNSWIERFLEDSRDQEESIRQEGGELEWHRSRTKVVNARNNLCYSVLLQNDNELKIELIEHLNSGQSYCEDSLKKAVNQCQNLEISKALLNYEKAALEYEDTVIEQNNINDDWNSELASEERKQQIQVLELKISVLEIEIEVNETNDPFLKEMIAGDLKEKKQYLAREEEVLADLQIENLIKQADRKKIQPIDETYENTTRELHLNNQWREQEIIYLEEDLRVGEPNLANEVKLLEMKSQLKTDQLKLQTLDNEEEIKSVTLKMQINEEIAGSDKAASYPKSGRRFSDDLRQRSEDNFSRAHQLRDLELERHFLKLSSDLNQCEQDSENLLQTDSLSIKMTLCNRIKQCNDVEAKDLVIEYLQNTKSLTLPDAAFELKNPHIRKVFTEYGLSMVESNYKALSENNNVEAGQEEELGKNALLKSKAVLAVRDKMIEAEIAGEVADQEELKEELRVAQVNLTKARIELRIYHGERSWQMIQANVEENHQKTLLPILEKIAQCDVIISEMPASPEDAAKAELAKKERNLLEVQQKIRENIFQQAIIQAKSATYNHDLVDLITSLPRSETQFNGALEEEMSKISPQTKIGALKEYKKLCKELGRLKVLNPNRDATADLSSDLGSEIPNNSPEKVAVVTAVQTASPEREN